MKHAVSVASVSLAVSITKRMVIPTLLYSQLTLELGEHQHTAYGKQLET